MSMVAIWLSQLILLGDCPMVQCPREPSRNETPDASSAKDDMVITPAGPVRKENVHRVGPDEVVRRNQDGEYTVVRKPSQN